MNSRRSGRGAPFGPDLRGVRDAIARALGEHVPDGVRTGELDRGGRALRWVEAGRGGVVPVVLIAGAGSSSLTWVPVLPELAEYGRVVAYDRAGLGASEPGHTATPTLDGQIADLTALVEHLDAGPVLLVGHSWGGQLAQLLTWLRPELVAGLVLVDPAHEEFQPRSIRVAESVLNRIWLYRAARAAQASKEPQPTEPTVWPVEPLGRAEAAEVAHRHQRRTILAEQRMTASVVREVRRSRSAARPPEVPLVVLSATDGLPRGMRSRWTAMQAAVADGAVRGTHRLVRGAGHAIQADRPQAVTEAVGDCVDQVRSCLEN
ncbi:alpha/beta fold hydrolase [Kitasatospora sp. NPDC056651]|uniref:alpha/beta fold hydrolase n=1 Tax=Kitasatospora sp. NPDC056651 TaxID=3345892 RepID=UPI00367C6D20